MEKTFIVTPVGQKHGWEMKGKDILEVKRRLAGCGRKFIVKPLPENTYTRVLNRS